MERKSFKFELKAVDEESGSFEGIASAYRKTPDKVKDIVDPGAFTKTINDNGGKTLLTYPPHDIDSIVGEGELIDTPNGLMIKGSIIPELSMAKDAYHLLKRGIIKTLSIGYEVVKQEMVNGIRHLKEIKLYEVALVPGGFAADDMALITSVKTEFENRLDAVEQEIKSGRTFSAEKIKVAIKSLGDLLKEIENAQIVDLTGEDDSDSTSENTEPSEDTQEDKEAAEIDGAIARIEQNINTQTVEAKIDNILTKIRSN